MIVAMTIFSGSAAPSEGHSWAYGPVRHEAFTRKSLVEYDIACVNETCASLGLSSPWVVR